MNSPKHSLGLFDATTIVMGSMIGSGVFIVAADIGRQVGSPGLMLMAWVATALLTLIAALSYGELAAMMPKAGGQYIYLREAFGPLYGFLYGWTFFTVIQTGTIAAVAVAFAKFLGVFAPELSQKGVAMVLIVFLTWLNTRGLRTGALVQNVFTVAKTGALLGLIGAAFLFGRSDAAIARNFGANFWAGGFDGLTALRVLGVALVGSLFSSDSWNNVTFTAGETRDPQRNVPLSLLLGVGLVSILYLLANYAYLLVLPFEQIQNAAQDRVGTAAASAILGPVAVQVMAAAIMVSTFGCANGLTLAGARVYYAMALDNLFFRQAARLDPRTQAPSTSLWIQCLWACGLTLTGSYSDLLDYVIFAVLLFYILTIVGIFVLRRKRPEAPRPYKAFGYPLLPGLYILLAGGIELLLLLYKPSFTWPGLIIVLLGIPVYFWWTKGKVNA
ncbi:MAG: APC family permease [Acidobacteriota bacterium]|jgi:APA family basic amino acid/polyamine antiporter|nr:amino acid permease [Bryobacteraceae bacterium CoA2 C42]